MFLSTFWLRQSEYSSFSSYSKKLKRREHSQIFIMRPPLPWYQNQTKTLPKKNLQTNIPDEHRCKNLQQNTSKLNLTIYIKRIMIGLPWWCSGWESACQCRRRGFEPWYGKIPHATEQLGPWATTTEPARLEPVLRNKRHHDSERPVHRDEGWPLLAAVRESPRTETKTQHSQKFKKKIASVKINVAKLKIVTNPQH